MASDWYPNFPIWPQDPDAGYDGKNPETACSRCGVRKTLFTSSAETGIPGSGSPFGGIVPFQDSNEIGIFGWPRIRKNAEQAGIDPERLVGKATDDPPGSSGLCVKCLQTGRAMKNVANRRHQTKNRHRAKRTQTQQSRSSTQGKEMKTFSTQQIIDAQKKAAPKTSKTAKPKSKTTQTYFETDYG